jgi:CBS domain-containing protein
MLTAADIMTQDVVTIRSSAIVADAVKLMKAKGLRALIVDRRNDRDAYGIITESDIVYKIAARGKDPYKMRVYEAMTKPCIVVNPELEVYQVARLLADNELHAAPVIQQKLLGIISLFDILVKSDFLEKPREVELELELKEAIDNARAICKSMGATSPECLTAWCLVEELQSEAAHQRSEKLVKTAFEEYCEEFPEAMEARMLENLCSG